MNETQPRPDRVPPPPATARTAVLFDFGGTLDADGIPWKERLFRLVRAEGVELPAEGFDRAFYRADDALVGAVLATLTFGETVRRLVEGLVRGLGLRDPHCVERIARQFLDAARDRLAGRAALLGELSRRYRLGVVSNFYGNLATVCHEAGLDPFLTVVVDSAQVGCVKPDPHIFRLALAGVRAAPAQAVFVGDSVRRDMEGARSVGMAHIWLRSETAREEGPCCPEDPVVPTLDALREVLL